MKEISSEEYFKKVLGSWIGRIAGDFVGAPIEFKPISQVEEKYGEIAYFPEPIDLNYVNDDEMYEICALIALENKGPSVSSKDIAQEWVNRLYKFNFTAEKVALKNLRSGVWPPESGIRNNEYFDAIGAQMRADIWGQVTPGCPKLAKYYAELDGCISHAGIGIEGEVFIAILTSQAFFELDIRENIKMALSYVPSQSNSLYTCIVKKAIDVHNHFPDDSRKARTEIINFWNKIKEKELIKNVSKSNRKRLNFLTHAISDVHVLPNIGIIILSLLYGAEDKEDQLGKSICTAAMMGLDTDCNCGNIGAIVGAQLGAEQIPSKWKDPLKNTFSTYVKDYEKWELTNLAKRITNAGRQIIAQKCKERVKIV